MPAGLYSPSSELEPILGIQFGIFSPEEIERRSVVEVTSHATYDGNEPKLGGLFDPRMGVLDNGKECRSCGQKNHNCPGHFGHYRLARPVYYIQFFPMVLNVLRCVCVRCAKLLIDKNLYKKIAKRRGEGRWREVLNACNNISRCGQQIEDGCGAKQPDRYVKEGIARIIAEWDEPTPQRQPLEVEYVLRLFRQVLDEDVDFMGLSRHWDRPDWMICSVLAVPPPQMRPSVVQDNNQRSEDDLTHKLVDIIKTNKTLQQKIDANASKAIIDEWTNVLQYHVATLINNQIPGVAPSAQRSGRAVKSIQQRLGSKEGRIRYNIQGKRVEFSARSVITPDPNLSIGELGVPMKIAMNLTFPDKVTPYNRDILYRYVQNGGDVYPGAKTIVRADGRMISLKHVNTKELVLYNGDTVNRHIMDGDIILFNRQPTLHRMSMMGHRARVLPYNTFRLNVSAVSPYNADFDGDEMNAHIPQSYEAATELEQIAAVRHQIVGPREGKPSIGIVQDTLVGSYLLTKNDNQFTRREFMNLMMYNKNFEGIPKAAASASATPGGERWSGHQVISSLLPPINMDMGNKSFDDDPSPKNKVKIVEGQVLNGTIDKDIFSKAGKGIVHVSYNDYGADSTVTMIDSLQTTVESFLVLNGFSVGISDMIADEKTRQQMEEVIQARKKEVNELNLQVHLDLFDNNTGKPNQDEFEARVFAALNKATKEAGEFGQLALAEENRLVAMVKAGSKGGPINIAQMIACVGQQNIEGKRIPYGFSDRTLPHYKKYDDGPEARGFIESSFIGGLSPQEFFFHAMSGREGLIDTAVKSVTGDTPIIIIENGEVKRVEIGPWIDAHLKTAPVGVIEQYDESQANLELLNITHDVTIPTVDADGKMSWGKITAITRHDPGNKIYEIKTYSGREVIVSAGKSMLVWNNSTSKFEEKPTTETKIGDYVPVTVSLPEPPVIQTKIELSKYLPKSKYVYGSDFLKAQTMIAATMDGRKKIPAGWWEANNGKTFTLPYPSKARLQRTQVRSDITQIESGYVYPFHASREISKTPEIFELTHENGIFLGLFLAEGDVDVHTGYVQITNNDSKILEFVKSWFTKRGLSTSEDSKINKVEGTSSCVRGFSSIFAQFLNTFVGHGAENKFVPSEAFIAPEEFITGLLNGYFSGDGCVGDGVVSAGSASKRLITGISVLCSRLGIFGRIRKTQLKTNNFGTINILPSYIIEIRSKWAKLFAQKIPMIHDNKQKKLENISTSFEHRNFPSHNDIVLDAITEINEMSTEKHPKLYDLTIPSTFNFVLENGHGTRDTADTGYIQRQLVKAMEDLAVQHDGTVRDANMHIVQFHYGEDGLNATKIEGTGISYAKISEGEVTRDFGLQKVDFATILSEGVLTEDFSASADVKAYLEQILKDRKMIVEGVFGSGRQGGVFAPLNPERLIMNIRVRFGLKPDGKTDLTPTYLIQGLNKLMERTQPYHKLWCALIRFHFAPHKLIVKERFTKAAFDALMELCVVKDWKAWSLPGELVGIIAAQSIGEPSTQMCSTYSTRIAVRNTKTQEHIVGPMGKFIDDILEKNKTDVINISETNVVLDLNSENTNYEIIGVSNDEKTSWKRISQVSRHPANGGLVEITTKSGRKTTATLTHSFLTRGPKGVIPILGSELTVGTRVPIARQIPEVANPLYSLTEGETTFQLTKDFGWLCGIYLADGSLNSVTATRICKIHPIVEEKILAIAAADIYKWDVTVRNYEGEYGQSKDTIIKSKDLVSFLYKHFSCGSYTKKISADIFQGNLAFIQGIISGYFDGDGNVNVERQQIRVGSRSKTLIHDIAALLSYCGIFGAFGEETSVQIPGKILYTYQVLKKYAAHFRATIGLHLNEKAAGLDAIVEYMERDGKHDTKEIYDKIPELGEIIAETGRLLAMPGQSRNFGRWVKKESIGRLTLQGYIEDFEEVLATRTLLDTAADITVRENIEMLKSAAYSDIIWDEIVELKILEDPKVFVYDFTVPGNDSFMVDDNILVHNTLNTFHLAGVAAKSNVTRGVPRLKELLKVTENPKAIALTVYLKPEFRENKDKVREVTQDLELTLLRDITVKTGIFFDPKDGSTVVSEDKELIDFYKLFEAREEEPHDTEGGADTEEAQVAAAGANATPKWSNWLLRLELDRERMFNKNISMDDISFALHHSFGTNFQESSVNLIYSDFNSKKLVMRIRLGNDDKSLGFGDDLAGLKKFQNKILNSIVIRGVPGIRAATFRKHADLLTNVDGEYKPIEQYVIDTDGTNFMEVMNHPAVDGSRIYSTHVHDIYSLLGVEATRACLLSELIGLFEEAGVNYRHLGILCDIMTRNGRLMSIDRYGINKSDNGPLAKASFEETEKILLKAALFGEVDPITGVSANIMTGQAIRAGTSFTQILLDETAQERLLQGMPPVEVSAEDAQEEEATDLSQEMIDAELYEDSNDACATTQLRMNITMPQDQPQLDEPDGELVILEA